MLISPTMLNSDPPDHTKLRGLASQAFTPAAVARLEPRIRTITEHLLSSVTDKAAFDVVDVLAGTLPAITMAELLGIPADDHATFKRWSDDIVSVNETTSLEETVRARRSAAELRQYLSRVVRERRLRGRGDLISELLEAIRENDRFDEDALLDMCILLLISGHQTTTNLISSAVLALARAPAQRERLHEEPALLPTAIEEFLRFDGPVQIDPRVATRDVAIGDTVVAAGTRVMVLLAAADRDPAQFVRPDELDVTRAYNPHLAFGRGIHYCLGATLARLEGRVAIESFLRRFPRFALARPASSLEYGPSFILRGLKRLDIVGVP